MSIRALHSSDFERIEVIHRKFYEDEFSIGDFESVSMLKFVATDSNDKIITAASVRSIAEIVAITDKDVSARERRKALLDVLQCAEYVCRTAGYPQLHAFVQDKVWLEHLKDAGFKDCKGKPIYINT